MMDPDATSRLLHAALPQIEKPTLVLDAAPLACLGDAPHLLHSLGGNVIVTPHAGEMAAMLGRDKAEIKADPQAAALEAAATLQAVVAMKGSQTFIAAPDGRLYLNRYGNIGLATSGSGDTLAGPDCRVGRAGRGPGAGDGLGRLPPRAGGRCPSQARRSARASWPANCWPKSPR